MRKYFTEFGLNVSTAYKTIIPVEHLDEVDDGHDYHIYFILSAPKIFVRPESILTECEGISLQIYKIIGGKQSELQDIKFALCDGIDHRKLKIECMYPFTSIEIQTDTGEKIPVDAQVIMNYVNPGREWIFDVLYIGQAYGKQGNRHAQDRLKSHSTLQKILTDCNVKYPDRRIYILLLEVAPILNSVMDGINKGTVSDEEENRHFSNIFENPLKMEQIINITEAALINYFKPEYNINFVDNFPDSAHKGYSQYYDLDYNSISVELDLEFNYPYPWVQLVTETNSIRTSFDFVQYNLFNDPDRKNMYDIFERTS